MIRFFGRYRLPFHWLLLFVLLLVAAWLLTWNPLAPQLLLLVLLYLVTVNFSIPLRAGYVGMTPLVILGTLLALPAAGAVPAGLIGLVLAELVRPFWRPLWQSAAVPGGTRWQRLLLTGGQMGLLIAGSQVGASPVGGLPPGSLTALVVIGGYLGGVLLLWLFNRLPFGRFLNDAGGYLSALIVAAVPTLLLADPANTTQPALVLFSVLVTLLAVIAWTLWQRRQEIRRQLEQFSLLNRVGESLRETLDLETVVQRTGSELVRLISADQVTVVLAGQNGQTEQHCFATDRAVQPAIHSDPDDLTRWVLAEGRLLDLDSQNMHHAHRRQLRLPDPEPGAWLGVPLKSADRPIGALILQKSADSEPFTRWDREMLLAVAGQASAAIQNARLYQETLRLYNLTDAALARRLEQLQALLDAITEGVLMFDTQGRLLLENRMAVALIGRSAEHPPQTVLDTALATRLGIDESERLALLDGIGRGELPPVQRTVYQCDNHRWIERYGVPVLSAEQAIMGWLIILRDITDERERAEWRADLTRMIVHDLRNPVSTVSSTVTLIERRLPADQLPTIADLLVIAQHGCTTLLEMVDSLMDINRAEAGTFRIDAEEMNPAALLHQVFDRMRPLAMQREVRLVAVIGEDVPMVWGDADALRRVLVNLLDNALKFTPAGGTVRGEVVREEIVAESAENEDGVRITIIDNGPGIPAEQRQRIFERFVTFNPGGGQVRGTGLGLTWCKLATEAHGGTIRVDEAPGGGSAFHVTIPGLPVFGERDRGGR
jgi:signal transduction histidine kinase